MPTPETIRDLLRRLIAHPPLGLTHTVELWEGTGTADVSVGSDVFGLALRCDVTVSSWGQYSGLPLRFVPRLATLTFGTPYGNREPIVVFWQDAVWVPLPPYTTHVYLDLPEGVYGTLSAIKIT